MRSYVCLYDAEAAGQARAAGVGASLTLTMGGKTDELHGQPIQLEVRVRTCHDGPFVDREVRHGGRTHYDMGPTAVVETDLPPGTSPLSKLDLGPFEVHSMV